MKILKKPKRGKEAKMTKIKKPIAPQRVEKATEKAKGEKPKADMKIYKTIETNIDKLYKMILERGSLGLYSAARDIGVSVELIEEWGKVLEEHKMIEMHYPPFGKAILRVPSTGKEKAKHVKKEEKKKETIPGKEKPKKMKKYATGAVYAVLGIIIFFFIDRMFLGSKVMSYISGIGIGGINMNLLAVAIIIIGALMVVFWMIKFKPKKKRRRKK